MIVTKCCKSCIYGKNDGGIPPYTCTRQGMDTYGNPHFPDFVCKYWKGREMMGWDKK